MLLLGFAQTFCFNTQPPEGGWQHSAVSAHIFGVSTHSRPKAAGCPPISSNPALFQHTAARRRLVDRRRLGGNEPCVSTHSRPKAAGILFVSVYYLYGCFNTQPPEGGWVDEFLIQQHNQVSTHSRPKAAGLSRQRIGQLYNCFNTQPPEGGWDYPELLHSLEIPFQHTAARRRLAYDAYQVLKGDLVSTHSRPKAAGCSVSASSPKMPCFNTQPPEGGWFIHGKFWKVLPLFQHTAARRRLVPHES